MALPDTEIAQPFLHARLGLSTAARSAIASALVFAILAAIVSTQAGDALDGRALAWIRSYPNGVLESASLAINSPMCTWLLIAIEGGAALALAIRRDWKRTAFLAACFITAACFSPLAKILFARPRPPAIHETLTDVSGFGFPSGHALASATLALCLFLLVPHNRRSPWFGAVLATIVVAVGASRVYLGAHYPLDVLAGWAAAIAIASSTYLRFVRCRVH